MNKFFFLLLNLFFLAGCSNLNYLVSSVQGHLEVINKTESVDDLIVRNDLNKKLKKKLLLAEEARLFAFNELGIKRNNSYTTYADLNREAVVWNVFAATEFSLELKEWCFLIVGCFNYKGFFKYKEAEQFAKSISKEKNLEISIVPIPAYSTLGWSEILGGDPILNTFINYPDSSFVGLIFHEFAHQKIFVKGDTTFNESLATAVENIAVNEWLLKKNNFKEIEIFKKNTKRKNVFYHKIYNLKKSLNKIYKSGGAKEEKRKLKKILMNDFRNKLLLDLGKYKKLNNDDYAWVKKINNSYIGSIGLYQDFVPSFEELFKRNNKSWETFFIDVDRISKLNKNKRRFVLKKLLK